MLNKIKTLWALMQAGKRVNNPQAWKKGQVASSAVAAFLMAAVAAFAAFTGIDIEVGSEQINSLSVALVAIVPAAFNVYNIIATVISTNKIGLQR